MLNIGKISRLTEEDIFASQYAYGGNDRAHRNHHCPVPWVDAEAAFWLLLVSAQPFADYKVYRHSLRFPSCALRHAVWV